MTEATGAELEWRKRRFDKGEYVAWLDEFDEIYVELLGPKMMMMISTDIKNESEKIDIWVQAQGVFFTGLFKDFESVSESKLPATATLLIGDHDEFFKVFPHQGGVYDREIARHRAELALAQQLLDGYLNKNLASDSSKESLDEVARLKRNIDRQTKIIAAYEERNKGKIGVSPTARN